MEHIVGDAVYEFLGEQNYERLAYRNVVDYAVETVQPDEQESLFLRELKRFAKLQLEAIHEREKRESLERKKRKRLLRESRQSLRYRETERVIARNIPRRENWERELEEREESDLVRSNNERGYWIYRVKNTTLEKTIENFVQKNRGKILHKLKTGVKVVYTMEMVLENVDYKDGTVKTKTIFPSSVASTLLTEDSFQTSIDSIIEFFNGKLSEIFMKGSGWTLRSLESLSIKLFKL